MRRTLAVISTGALAALLALGTASALVSDSSSESSLGVESTSTGNQTIYEVGAAGTVTIGNDGSMLSVVAVNQAPGWVIEIETATGREVEVDFRNGNTRIQFNAELEDGEVRVRARERTTTSSTVNTTGSTSSTTSTTTAGSPKVTVGTTTSATAYVAGAGGTVNIVRTGNVLAVTSVNPASGWTFEIEVSTGREVEVDFRRNGERVQFNAELEDGEIRIRVRALDDSNDDNSSDDDSLSDSADSSRSDDNDSNDDESDDNDSGDDDSSDD